VPKGGTSGQRHATDEEWKGALKLRLEELGWSNAEFARRLGVTPGAVTHLFKKAVTSTLRPRIEKLVGWPDPAPSRLAVGTRRSSDPETTPVPSKGEINSGELAELISLYQSLNSENRVRLIERAHTLRDGEGDGRRR
jgi:transcriptional regulator with XRE-family HTH domain